MAKRGRKEKDNWKKKRRQEYLEKKEFRYYIFCEGQATEPKYFQGFKRYIEDNPIYRDMVLIEIEGCQAETMRVIGKAEEYVRENKKFLNEKFQELGIGKYEKNMDNIFETLMNGGNPKLAIRYAKRIIKNGEGKTPAEIAPGTKVYELVEELAKYLPEEIRKQFLESKELYEI